MVSDPSLTLADSLLVLVPPVPWQGIRGIHRLKLGDLSYKLRWVNARRGLCQRLVHNVHHRLLLLTLPVSALKLLLLVPEVHKELGHCDTVAPISIKEYVEKLL